jgi:cytoskeletal protein RodZ
MRRRLNYANVTATLALFFAMSGGALAAKHYLINSTKQINPKVLKALTEDTSADTGTFNSLTPSAHVAYAGSAGSATSATNAINATNAANAANAANATNATKATSAGNAERLGGVGAGSYLQSTVTEIGQLSVANLTTRAVSVFCPAGYQAVGGGVDNALDTSPKINVTTSAPIIHTYNEERILGQWRPTEIEVGENVAADGWIVAAHNESGSPDLLDVAVICAP